MAISTTTAIFRKSGDTLDYTAAADIPAGAIKTVNGLNCIALSPIPSGTVGALKVIKRGELLELATNESIGATLAGVAIYVDSSGLATKTSTSNTLLGYTAAAVSDGDLSFTVVCV